MNFYDAVSLAILIAVTGAVGIFAGGVYLRKKSVIQWGADMKRVIALSPKCKNCGVWMEKCSHGNAWFDHGPTHRRLCFPKDPDPVRAAMETAHR